MSYTSVQCITTMATLNCLDELELFLTSIDATYTTTCTGTSDADHRDSSVSSSHDHVAQYCSPPSSGHCPPEIILIGTTSPLIAQFSHRLTTTEYELLQFQFSKSPLEWQNEEAPSSSNKKKALVYFIPILDKYLLDDETMNDDFGRGERKGEHQKKKFSRSLMEHTPGTIYPTLHCEFMMEKSVLLEYALMLNVTNVLFLDVDIITLFPMPLVPVTSLWGVSPHGILEWDELLFGKYNGGWVYCGGNTPDEIEDGITAPTTTTSQKKWSEEGGRRKKEKFCRCSSSLICHWRKATLKSRYFDQASLEDVVHQLLQQEGEQKMKMDGGASECRQSESTKLWKGPSPSSTSLVHFFPPQCNFGYWRMFQATESVEQIVRRFQIQPVEGPFPPLITYQGQPLQSIHTHFGENFVNNTTSKSMPLFNQLMVNWLQQAIMSSPTTHRGVSLGRGAQRHFYRRILAKLLSR